MNRKLICLMAALSLALPLSACTGGGDPAVTDAPVTSATAQPVSGALPTAAATAQPAVEYDSFVFPVPGLDGEVLTIDQDMTEVLSILGEAQSYFEAASCAFDGLDKTYTYSGFCVTTRPDGDKDYVNSILLLDDSVTTAEGVYIGSAKSDVTAVYGEGDDQGTAITYNKGSSSLTFIFDADSVISIEYLPV